MIHDIKNGEPVQMSSKISCSHSNGGWSAIYESRRRKFMRAKTSYGNSAH